MFSNTFRTPKLQMTHEPDAYDEDDHTNWGVIDDPVVAQRHSRWPLMAGLAGGGAVVAIGIGVLIYYALSALGGVGPSVRIDVTGFDQSDLSTLWGPEPRTAQISKGFGTWRTPVPGFVTPEAFAPMVFRPSVIVPPGADVIDSTRLKSGDRIIRLAGLIGIGADDTCAGPGGRSFACGMTAVSWLSNFIAGQSIACYPDVSMLSSDPAYLCRIRSEDLGLFQIQAGYARSMTPGVPTVSILAERARQNRSGAWQDGWKIVPGTPEPPPDPAK